ncbi:MAG TPA: hypothetical protein VHP30_10595 [Ignavibacteriales bacterium]|nr:hypothetical protein [Ignavibacteriales bacterium]
MRTEQHIEIDFCQTKKNGENALGDVFLSHKDKEQSRIIAVLSDGLGSGIKANLNFSFKPQDDISCAVVYFRKPRKTLIATGPPFSKEKDRELASTVKNFNGKKIVCGGTTAHIIAREWGQTLNETAYESYDGLPPESELAGIDITAEGVITLNKTAEILKEGTENRASKNSPAVKIADQLINSDVVEFLVGSRISEVFQDPNISFELEIRRNLIKNIASILEEKYLKETHIKFI